MSDIKMSDWFNLPTTTGKFWLAPVELDNGDRRQGQMIALVHAINSHDTMQTRITELETALTNIKKHQETVIVGMQELSAAWQIASRALEK
jgi:3-phenylpropionate/cinnamic acid dioxygenase small subunit